VSDRGLWLTSRGRVGRRKAGAAGFLDGGELHQFHANGVGVEEVELPLAVFAHLGARVEIAEAVFGRERGDGLLHIYDAEGEVIEDAELFERNGRVAAGLAGGGDLCATGSG
jgi:hypothetical protein